ncbi:MAG: crossover junction endodeoxyribonuclease RuvC [Oscillospiraceae bacterium]|nr:crossover junction endodeoxyribonuclease RuvC [Oscillospiraceae bacterium]
MRILGIDPGYATVGFGVVDYQGFSFKTLEYGAILTEAHTDFPGRLLQIYTDMVYLLEKYRPQALSVEKLYFNTNKTTGIMVAEARGVILLACAEKAVPVFEYTPLQVKSAVVGYGKAEKRQVMDMTRRILHLSEIPKPDDAADALALAICHGHCAKPDY